MGFINNGHVSIVDRLLQDGHIDLMSDDTGRAACFGAVMSSHSKALIARIMQESGALSKHFDGGHWTVEWKAAQKQWYEHWAVHSENYTQNWLQLHIEPNKNETCN